VAEGVELAIGAMILFGVSDWIYKRAVGGGVAAHQLLALQTIFFAPGIYAYGLLTGTLALGPPVAWGMLAGALIFFALYHFARSLATGAVSVVAPVFRLSFAVTTALAVWLLDEPLTEWKLAGLSASLAAVWLLVGGGPVMPLTSRVPLLRVLVATVVMGIVSLLYKVGIDAGGTPATVLAAQASVFFPLATGFAFVRDRRFTAPARGFGYAAATAALLLIGRVMLLAGLARGEASVLVPVAQMSFVVTAALGYVLLRERLTLRIAVGLASGVVALACFAHS
jgi:drug/metabolite transporter (DMT)-like permease